MSAEDSANGDAAAEETPAPAAAAGATEEKARSEASTPSPAECAADCDAPAVAAGPSSGNNDPRFDHTSRKVVVHNVLKYIRAKEIAKLTATWLKGHEDKIKIVKTKKPPKDNWVKVTLEDESMVDPFIQLINTGGEGGKAMVNNRGKQLFAKRAEEMFTNDGRNSVSRGGDSRKRKERDDRNGGDNRDGDERGNNKRSRPEIRILSNDEVRDKITPLWRMTYEEQLDSKAREMVNKCAKRIVKDIKGKFRILEKEAKRGQRKGVADLYDWVQQKRAIDMEQPVPSPKTYGYRNKCEFTVGYRLMMPEGEKEEKDNEAEVKVKAEEGDGEAAEASGDGKVKAEEMGDGAVKSEPTAEEAAKEAKVKAEDDMDNGDVKADEATEEAKVKDEEMEEAAAKAEDAKADAKAKAEEVESTTNKSIEFRKVPACGFMAQGWSGGVYPPHCLTNMPDWSCGLADIFNEFLPSSPIPPYDSKVHRGVWRTVTLRLSLRTRECMVIVLHAPAKGGAGAREDGSDDYSEAFEAEKKRLVEMLTDKVIPTPKRDFPEGHDSGGSEGKEGGEGDEGIRVTSIFFQEFEGLSNPKPDHPVQHVYGKKSLEEKLGKCTFQISPGAFFQTNTEGAEVLYGIVVDRIKEVTPDPKQTLLLDVCCGTGTIGLTCLKEGVVGNLVGVDIAEPAIADAKINAAKNGYTESDTTRFIASAAEKVLPDAMRDMPRDKPIVAVVDPARDGLHGIVIRTLRANHKIQRLVYVSCNPTGTLVRDASMLCGPPTKKYPGRPFKITRSQPVDMFPSTKHIEAVMTFDRMSKEEYEKYHGDER